MRRTARFLALAAVIAVVGCNRPEPEPLNEEATPPEGTARESDRESPSRMPEAEQHTAAARIEGKSGSSLSGEATLMEQDDSVEIVVRLSNATPGPHAVHLHENGDCSGDDASGAGQHWNPTDSPHGKRGSGSFHVGDIGNVEVGPDGSGTLTVVAQDWSLDAGGENDPVGKAIVVHAQADDFTTQPDGGAGQKVGCGVVERRKMTSASSP